MRKRTRMPVIFAMVLPVVTPFANVAMGGTEYQWVAGATDWTSAASYTNTAVAAVNTSVPGTGDVVSIPENCTLTLDCSRADDLAIANSLEKIRPLTPSSFFVVTVPDADGVVTLNPKVNFKDSADYECWYLGGLVKRGPGTLVLGSSSGHYDYFTDITVEQGTLKLPQSVPGWTYRYYDLIAVSNGATLFTCETSGMAGNALTSPIGLVGEGVVTNGCSNWCFLEIQNNNRTWSHEFAGRLCGSIFLHNGRGRFDLTGVNNTFKGIMAVRDDASTPLENVAIGLKKIGMKSDPESSAGAYSSYYGIGYYDIRAWNRNKGAGYLYLGDGETTDKDFIVQASNRNAEPAKDPNFLDAGANGGLTLKGELRMRDAYNQRFILTGSNSAECVVAGPIKKYSGTDDPGTNHNWRIIKRGAGTWRFSDVAGTEMAGVFAVENGTLAYDSIADAGTLCSLGYSTQLLEDYTGKVDDSRRVDYAFELGSVNDPTADPVFEYRGSSTNWCFSRPIALKGSARLRHSGGGELRLANVRTLNDTPKTLTLDGDGDDAWLFNVSDAHGTLSLVKDGGGAWTVAGTNQISGSISVKGGTLNLRHHEAPFTYFRWTHKQTRGTWRMCNIELGLYDSDGARLNGGLAYQSVQASKTENLMMLAEGQVALGTDGFADGATDMVYMFDNNSDTKWDTAHRPKGEATWRQAYIEDPTSWFSVVMRLTDTSAEVASYDILEYGEWANSKTGNSRAFSLKGSADGVNWHMLDDYDGGDKAYGGQQTAWCFGGETYGNGNSGNPICMPNDIMTHTTGKAVAGHPVGLPVPMANVTNVSVAAGATLAVIGGEAIALPSGVRLIVDASGAGTFKNVIFPEKGTLEVSNLDLKASTVEIPLTRKDVDGFDNIAKWKIVANGDELPVSRMKCRVSETGIILYRPGMVVVVR